MLSQSLRSVPRVFTSGAVSRFYSNAPSFSNSSEVKYTKLDNGITVVTGLKEEDSLASVGLYVQTGSAFENHKNHGASHYLRRFLFKGTNRTSGLRITRTIETLTTGFQVENNPEYLSYKAAFPQEYLDHTLAVMGDLLRPRLAEWEFREVRSLVKHDVQERKANHRENVLDQVRHTAYGGVGLGRSPLCPEYNVNELYPEDLAEYILGNVIGSRITVVGNVTDHEALVKAAANGLGGLQSDAPVDTASAETSNYIGGTKYICDGPESVYAEAYKGAPANSKESLAQRILMEILGSSHNRVRTPGGYGSSRLAKECNNGSIEAHPFILNDSQTVMGIQAIGNVPCRDLASLVHNQLVSLADSITQEEFEAARALTYSKVLQLNDQRYKLLDGIFRASTSSTNPQKLSDVTLADVKNVAKDLVSGKPTVYASGDLHKLPTF
mmetsp:Transcript_35435/g.60725  ORF Transcript_35435/g.60725 Transcript_35435/m.60725 type:complete len:440 (-) Transcript_35435:138-1457(-)